MSFIAGRRTFLKAGAAGLAATALCRPAWAGAKDSSRFALSAGRGEVIFAEEQENPTRVMYYNQSIPGPLIRVPQGREIVIPFHNGLDEPTTVHWHGLRIANAMDGVADMTQPPVPPGQEFEYRFTPPDAGTYWYHTHMRSWAQMAFGLAGVLIVDEPNPPPVDQDLVFAIDDWRFDRQMQVDEKSLGSMHDWSHGGRLGNFITVNGETEKVFAVASGERIRLRLVNIANSRIMNLLFGEPRMQVVAIDGQPLEPFAPEDGRIRLAPGQRFDLVIDVTGDPGTRRPIEIVVGEYAYEIAYFEFAPEPKRKNLLQDPVRLPDNPLNRTRLPTEFRRVPLVMQGGAMGGMRAATWQGRQMEIRELVQNGKAWAFNGIVGMPEAPLFSVARGTPISLDVDNDNAWPHVMHVHGHHFVHQGSPGIWRDTALFERGEKASLRFIADNPGKWLIHCHMAEHMAAGMLTWFEVT